MIRRKWSDAALISNAITAIEEDPQSNAQARRQLVEQMKTHGAGGEAVAQIQFNI